MSTPEDDPAYDREPTEPAWTSTDIRSCLDEHGHPVPKTEMREPVPCDLCGQIAEAPIEVHGSTGGGESRASAKLLVCSDCHQLFYTDSGEYWRRVGQAIERKQP